MIFTIIPKVLALVDAFLGYFATATGSSSVIVSAATNCGSCTVTAYDYTMTACGTDILNRTICLIDVMLVLAPQLMGAVFAY